jgi:hypothetical protein
VVGTGKSYEFLPYLYSIEYGKRIRIHKKHKRFDVPLNLKIAETGEKILEQILRDYLERDTYTIKRLEKSGLKDKPYDLIIKRRGKQSILIDFKGVYKVKLNKQDKEGHLVIDCRHAAELSQMRGIPVLAYSDSYSLLIHRALEEMRERNEKRFRILKERPFYVIAERLPSVYVNFNKIIEAHEEREIEFNPRFVFVRRCRGLKKAGGDYKQKTALLIQTWL